jgi:hypothetical protein
MESLGGKQHIDIQSGRVRCGSSSLARLSPQLRREAKGIIRQWYIAI